MRFCLSAFQAPIIVKIVEPNKDPTGLADILLGALGLSGVIILIAVLLGVAMAVVLFWIRSRQV
jgi:ABC-type phosphate transport system permease subunit